MLKIMTGLQLQVCSTSLCEIVYFLNGLCAEIALINRNCPVVDIDLNIDYAGAPVHGNLPSLTNC